MANSILEYLKKFGKAGADSVMGVDANQPQAQGGGKGPVSVEDIQKLLSLKPSQSDIGESPSWAQKLMPRKTDPMSLPSQPSEDEISMGAYDPSAAFMREALQKEEERKRLASQRQGMPRMASR